MNTLNYILKKYNLNPSTPLPIEIPNMGRDNLGNLFNELGYTVGAEIGTERGLFSEVLCKANPKLKLFCIDPWRELPSYRAHVKQDLLDEIYANAVKRLTPYRCRLIKSLSEEAVEKFKDRSLDFVYIDANHDYEHVTMDLNIWCKKVKSGGIVSGHDYARNSRSVIQAVTDFTRAKKIVPWFTIGREARMPNEIRDLTRSYMWVNC
jgi:hypothetical protein